MNKFTALLTFFVIAATSSTFAAKTRWVQTNIWSGNGYSATEVINIVGHKWRLRYKPSAKSGNAAFEIEIYDLNGRPYASAGGRKGVLKGSKSYSEPGMYYLMIKGVDTKWEISLEQRMTVIEEWEYRQWLKRVSPVVRRLGTWADAVHEAEYTFKTVGPGWKAVASSKGPGKTTIQIRDLAGTVLFNSSFTGAGESSGWCYAGGTFKVYVFSNGPEWKLDLFEIEGAPLAQPPSGIITAIPGTTGIVEPLESSIPSGPPVVEPIAMPEIIGE